jgi:8-oxo-dGTP pyrophosphatase MutT (NUDIX family)
MIWKPSVTVATVVERDGRFLLVEEETDAGIRFNQPAGHLDPGEGPAEGAVRETLEETAYSVRPDSLVGIYRWHSPANDVTYLRFAFAARVLAHHPERPLDTGILRTHWLSVEELRTQQPRHRSPLVLRCVEDYLAGRRYPLDLIVHVP